MGFSCSFSPSQSLDLNGFVGFCLYLDDGDGADGDKDDDPDVHFGGEPPAVVSVVVLVVLLRVVQHVVVVPARVLILHRKTTRLSFCSGLN